MKAQDENWDADTQDQARQTFDLLARFLAQECKVTGLAGLRQSHLASFVKCLRFEICKYYGKSEHDKTRTIAALRKIALRKPEALRGVGGTTLNRHLGNIAQLVRHGRVHGISIDIGATQFAVDGQVEHRQVAGASFHL